MICTASVSAASTFTNNTAANAILAAASTIRAAPTLGTAVANQLACVALTRFGVSTSLSPSPYNTSNKQNQSSRQTIFRKHSRSPYSICISIRNQKSNTNLSSQPLLGSSRCARGIVPRLRAKIANDAAKQAVSQSRKQVNDLANQSGTRQNTFAQGASRQSEDCQSVY